MANHAAVTIPLEEIQRIQIYINEPRKTLAQIKQETGADYLLNGTLYNMSTGAVNCHLKADGEVIASPSYTVTGYAWNTGPDIMMDVLPNAYAQNYIACTPLIVSGAKLSKLTYDPGQGGKRGRSAIGIKQGRLALYCTKDGSSAARTPEALRDDLFSAGWESAVMLDGGGSSQCDFNGEQVTSTRKVQHLILVYLRKETQGGEPMFKIALGAGHGLKTEGKRCMKALDPNETREWWLNDRICDYVESYLKDYEGYKLLRLDDSDDGAVNVPLADRVKAANNFGADFYLSVHHNAGINGGSGGGIVVYVHPNSSTTSREWQGALYDALIDHTGLKGNRTQPKAEGNYYVLKHTKMPAVLLELGFMDSKTDVPIILTNEYAQQCAKAIVEVIVAKGKLTKKPVKEESVLYKVQVGAFSKKENADKLLAELKAKGYQGYIVRV